MAIARAASVLTDLPRKVGLRLPVSVGAGTAWEPPKVALLSMAQRNTADLELFKEVATQLLPHVKVIVPHALRSHAPSQALTYKHEEAAIQQLNRVVDFIISVGDQYASRAQLSLLFPQEVPALVPIRTQLDVKRLEDIVNSGFVAHYSIVDRLRLHCLLERENTQVDQKLKVIHDLVLHRAPSVCPSQAELVINDHHFTTVVADGLVVATPSGSDGYGSAAGGALLHPHLQCFQVVPINPCSLSFRPVVFGPQANLKLEIPRTGRRRPLSLLADGSHVSLDGVISIKIKCSKYPMPSVAFPGTAISPSQMSTTVRTALRSTN